MIDGRVLLIALMALCGANLAMIWQVSTLADRVHDVQEDMHATARWLARMEAYRLRVAGRKEDGGHDDEDERLTAKLVQLLLRHNLHRRFQRTACHCRQNRQRDGRAAKGRRRGANPRRRHGIP